MNLQPSEFVAKAQAPDNDLQGIATYSMAPGTVVCLRNRIFVLVDDTDTGTDTDTDTTTDTNTDKENNND